MNRTKLQNQRHEIMEALEQEFVDELVPAKLAMDEELQTEVLALVMEELAEDGLTSTGEFFFKPVLADDEDIQLFCNIITILEEPDEQNLGELYSAIIALNALIPVGCFAINLETGALIYRHNYEMPLSLDTESLRASVDLCMSAAFATVQQFSYLLIEVNEGARKAQSVIDVLTL